MQRNLREAGVFDVVATTGRGIGATRLGNKLAPDFAVSWVRSCPMAPGSNSALRLLARAARLSLIDF